MHVSVLIRVFRSSVSPIISDQTPSLNNCTLVKSIDCVYGLVTAGHLKKRVSPVLAQQQHTRLFDSELSLNNHSVRFQNNIKRIVHNLRRTRQQVQQRIASYRYLQQQWCKVTKYMYSSSTEDNFENGTAPAIEQTDSAVVTMDGTAAADVSSSSAPVEGVATAVNEATAGAIKRKSDETDEPEPSGRGKRRRGRGGKKLRPGERYIPPPQKRNLGVGFSQGHFDETSYYFEGGLRKVHPYYFDFKTYCKGRWIGKTLLEVFKSEFRAESIDYYQRAAKEGRIRLNETPIHDLSVVLRNNDHMRNTVHRHEPPVVGRPLEVLVDDGEVLVVNKPASIPVHPCGRFRHNTVIFILGKEQGVSELHTVHRLDRLTSGVLLFARTLEVSKKLDQLVRDRQMEKEYVCRVTGEFPEGELVCEEPILVVSFKVGLCRVDPKGKDCRTVFQRLSFNGCTSVVRCLPLTGRTHQIRVHLQYLGFPILRDPVYGSSAWGPTRGKGGLLGKSDEEVLKALVEEHRSKESLHLLDLPDDGIGIVEEEGSTGAEDVAYEKDKKTYVSHDTSEPDKTGENSPNEKATCSDSTDSCQQKAQATRDGLCSECKIVRPDPTEKDLIMYLHALRYKGPDFEYCTPLPDWAKEDWVEAD